MKLISFGFSFFGAAVPSASFFAFASPSACAFSFADGFFFFSAARNLRSRAP